MDINAASRLSYPHFNPVRPEETSKYMFALGRSDALQQALDHFGVRGTTKMARCPGLPTVYVQAATGVDQEKLTNALLTTCEQSRDESTSATRIITVLGYQPLDGMHSMWDFLSVVFTDNTVWLIPRHHVRKLDL